MESVTGIPYSHYENIQLVKYEQGQFYRVHHDFSDSHVGTMYGPRILTVFLYLNDVQEGGGTRFESLGHTSMAKRGKAVIWPSVLNDDLEAIDDWTYVSCSYTDCCTSKFAIAWSREQIISNKISHLSCVSFYFWNQLLAQHEALPVTSGVKYGANAWIHLRKFQNVPDFCMDTWTTKYFNLNGVIYVTHGIYMRWVYKVWCITTLMMWLVASRVYNMWRAVSPSNVRFVICNHHQAIEVFPLLSSFVIVKSRLRSYMHMNLNNCNLGALCLMQLKCSVFNSNSEVIIFYDHDVNGATQW